MHPKKIMKNPFTKNYPNVTYWVESQGRIEIGQDDYSRSLLRALNLGRMIWDHKTADEALQAFETELIEWFRQNE
ncbi:MAG: hypothetical protein GY749_37030 [Desulfobacteraceae bacterium]|nr:hypothetical protein [Desulfobacteraceae bacterium]